MTQGSGLLWEGERLQEAEWTEIELEREWGPSYSEVSRKGGWEGQSCTLLWKSAVVSFTQQAALTLHLPLRI